MKELIGIDELEKLLDRPIIVCDTELPVTYLSIIRQAICILGTGRSWVDVIYKMNDKYGKELRWHHETPSSENFYISEIRNARNEVILNYSYEYKKVCRGESPDHYVRDVAFLFWAYRGVPNGLGDYEKIYLEELKRDTMEYFCEWAKMATWKDDDDADEGAWSDENVRPEASVDASEKHSVQVMSGVPEGYAPGC